MNDYTNTTAVASHAHAVGKLRVFISYSRIDVAFADDLELALKDKGFAPVVDRSSLEAGVMWQERLGELIASCDTVVFVLTPTSAASTVCAWEVERAASMGKRLLVATIAPVPRETSVPVQLAGIHWVHCWRNPELPGSSQMKGFLELSEALRRDLGWLRQRTSLVEQAARWRGRGRPAEGPHLLKGELLREAVSWAENKPQLENTPDEVAAFLAASASDESRLLAEAEARLEERTRAIETAEIALAEKQIALTAAEEALREREKAAEKAGRYEQYWENSRKRARGNEKRAIVWQGALTVVLIGLAGAYFVLPRLFPEVVADFCMSMLRR